VPSISSPGLLGPASASPVASRLLGLGGDRLGVASTLDRFAYGWSLVSCLPGAMGDPQTAATGGHATLGAL
jgi:hypothetical protein